MIKAVVDAGICGFITTVTAQSEDLQMTNVSIETNCPNLKPLETMPVEVDAFVECFGKIGQGEIFEWCRKYCRHAACPVPTAIVKAVEAECELALPKSFCITITKEA